MQKVSIVNETQPLHTTLIAEYADTFFQRGRGWMFTPRIELNDAKLLVHPRQSRLDAAIHMLFVSFDLGIVWVNQDLKVVDKTRAKSWRLIYAPREPALYILEIHPDRLDEFSPGDQIGIIHA